MFIEIDSNTDAILQATFNRLPDEIMVITQRYVIEMPADFTTNKYTHYNKEKKMFECKRSLEDYTLGIKRVRNDLLAASDWTQMPDSPLSGALKLAWLEYRQALRDFPDVCDPVNPVWPVKPGTVGI